MAETSGRGCPSETGEMAKYAKALCLPGRLLLAPGSRGPKLLWAGLPFWLNTPTPRALPLGPRHGALGEPSPENQAQECPEQLHRPEAAGVGQPRGRLGSGTALQCHPTQPPGSQSQGQPRENSDSNSWHLLKWCPRNSPDF